MICEEAGVAWTIHESWAGTRNAVNAMPLSMLSTQARSANSDHRCDAGSEVSQPSGLLQCDVQRRTRVIEGGLVIDEGPGGVLRPFGTGKLVNSRLSKTLAANTQNSRRHGESQGSSNATLTVAATSTGRPLRSAG